MVEVKQAPDKGERYRKFFQELADTMRDQKTHWGNGKITESNYQHFPSGFGGIVYSVVFLDDGRAVVALNIERGGAEQSWWIFDRLKERKDAIQCQLPEPLEWYHADGVIAHRIRVAWNSGASISITDADAATLEKVRVWMAERLPQFREVFTPYLRELVR